MGSFLSIKTAIFTHLEPVDKYNALKEHTKYMSDHSEEYEKFR